MPGRNEGNAVEFESKQRLAAADSTPGPSRRSFLAGVSLAAVAGGLGGSMADSVVPSAYAQASPPAPKAPQTLNFPGKSDKLVVLGERPLVAETPESLLDDDTTPVDRFFIRNNGQIPETATDPDKWKIVIDGEVENPLNLTLAELKSRFKPVTRRLVLECGGNGRAFFTPQARGNQWTNGGMGCAEWTGVKLADVLKAAKVKPSAVFTGHFGADAHLSGDTTKQALSRGMPIKKAMDDNNLIVWDMNGKPLPLIHGFPVRLIVPGMPGSVSEKWLTRIWVRDKPHDGQGMGGTSYRVPVKPIVPGDSKVDDANFRDLEVMPVRSIVTNPANGTRLSPGTREVKLRGAAWTGAGAVKQVDVSIDFGATWQKANLEKPENPFDWQRFTATVKLPTDGYYEIWSRATDARGAQPHIAGNWNPQGYGANPMHRIAVLVA